MLRKAVQIVNRDNDTLRGYAWKAINQDNLVGNIVIITGMQETAERYNDFAVFLVRNNYNVYCIDHYGQGMNAGANNELLGIWPESAFRKYVNTVDDIVIQLRISCRPTFIIGHSMGSFVLQDYIQRHTEHISKVVLVGTGRKPLAPVLGYALAKTLIHKPKMKKVKDESGKVNLVQAKPNDKLNWYKKNLFLHNLSLGNVNKRVLEAHKRAIATNAIAPNSPKPHPYSWLSVNDENVRKYASDPLCGGVFSGGFYREFFKGLSRINRIKYLKKIRPSLSIMIIGGSDDPIGGYGGELLKLHKVYTNLGIRDVQLKIYDGLRHEILNETGKEEVYDDILNFIQEQ